MENRFDHFISQTLADIKKSGLYKSERVILSPQSNHIRLDETSSVINLCSNNYLGLANSTTIIEEATTTLAKKGYGMASVRFICGTQNIHKELEARISQFLGFEDTILYSSCFDANTGLFETILGAEDAIISDSLNHASIIDGVRLCKAKRYRYANNDMTELENQLKETSKARFRLIATDGVFSMDGIIANLTTICDLAEKYDAIVMVDDSHAVGVLGENGKGTPSFCGVERRIDIVTGTLGKALGGASGGFTCASKNIIDLLRQRSRPYLFSNSLAPMIVATSIQVLDLLEQSDSNRNTLVENAQYFREKMTNAGFTLSGANHPIIPVMIGDELAAEKMAQKMLEAGVYVVSFSYPVVPKGQARIRTQMSSIHDKNDLDKAIDAFISAGQELGIVE